MKKKNRFERCYDGYRIIVDGHTTFPEDICRMLDRLDFLEEKAMKAHVACSNDRLRQALYIIHAKLVEENGSSHNRPITPCERHSCCNCGNSACVMHGVNCHKFVPRTV